MMDQPEHEHQSVSEVLEHECWTGSEVLCIQLSN